MLNTGATKKCFALEAVTNMTDFQQYISIYNEQQLTFLLLKKYMTKQLTYSMVQSPS